MKHTLHIMIALTCLITQAFSITITDQYQFNMSLHVPRVYDNMKSLGYRKYQIQSLKGDLFISYDNSTTTMSISNLINNTHRINSKKITYDCVIQDEQFPYVAAVGSNKSLKFSKCGIKFGFIADPSYNIGQISEDNSLYLELAGAGNIQSKPKYLAEIPSNMKGSVTGQIGCGCQEYGHTSPTRWYGGMTLLDYVIDTAPVYGTWKAMFKSRKTN